MQQWALNDLQVLVLVNHDAMITKVLIMMMLNKSIILKYIRWI